MRHPQLLYRLLFTALLLTSGCANRYNASSLLSRYDGDNALDLSKNSLLAGLQYQLHAFMDTISNDTILYLWNTYRRQLTGSPSDTGNVALIKNLQVMHAILKTRWYTMAAVSPCTYESIYALSKLPVLIWAVIIHHPDRKGGFISDKNLSLERTDLLLPFADNIRLHFIGMIDKTGNIYKITMRDGTILEGVAADHLNGQVTLTGEDADSKYLQTADCYVVTLLPLIELNEHIDEWYSAIPYEHKKPEIREIVY
jgi:hypothetical protein